MSDPLPCMDQEVVTGLAQAEISPPQAQADIGGSMAKPDRALTIARKLVRMKKQVGGEYDLWAGDNYVRPYPAKFIKHFRGFWVTNLAAALRKAGVK